MLCTSLVSRGMIDMQYIYIYIYINNIYTPIYTHQYTLHINIHQYTSIYINTHQYTSIHINTHQYTSIYINTHQYTSIHINTHQYTSIHINTHQYTSIHINTHQYISIHINTHQYTSIHINTHQYTSIHINTHQYTSIHINTHQYISIHINTHQYTSIHINTHQYTSIHINTHQYTSIHINTHQYTSIYISTHQYTSIHINIHQYTSIYINIHQYTSIYINIHQYTSIYTILKLKLWFSSVWKITSVSQAKPRTSVDMSGPPWVCGMDCRAICWCRYLDMPNLDPLDLEGGTWIHFESRRSYCYPIASYCYSCYSSHLTYFDILGFPFQQSHSSQCSAKETPTSIFWAKPREKQVLLRCLGFASRAEKTQEKRKTRKTSYDILWPVLWLDDVMQYEPTSRLNWFLCWICVDHCTLLGSWNIQWVFLWSAIM